MKWFVIAAIALSAILVGVALLLDDLMAIFIVCILTCVLVDAMGKSEHHKKPNE